MPLTRSQAKNGKGDGGTPRNYKKLAASGTVLDTPLENLPATKSSRRQRGAGAAISSSKNKSKSRQKNPRIGDGHVSSGAESSKNDTLALHAADVPPTSARKDLRFVVRKSFVMPPIIGGARGHTRRLTTRVVSEVVLDEPRQQPENISEAENSPQEDMHIVANLEAYSLHQFQKMTANANRIEAKFYRMLQDLTASVHIASRDSTIAILPKTPSKHALAKRALANTPGDSMGGATSSPALSKLQRNGTADSTATARNQQLLFKTPMATLGTENQNAKNIARAETDETDEFSTAVQWNVTEIIYPNKMITSPHAPASSPNISNAPTTSRALVAENEDSSGVNLETVTVNDETDRRDSKAPETAKADESEFDGGGPSSSSHVYPPEPRRSGVHRSAHRLFRAPGFKAQRFSVLLGSTFAAAASSSAAAAAEAEIVVADVYDDADRDSNYGTDEAAHVVVNCSVIESEQVLDGEATDAAGTWTDVSPAAATTEDDEAHVQISAGIVSEKTLAKTDADDLKVSAVPSTSTATVASPTKNAPPLNSTFTAATPGGSRIRPPMQHWTPLSNKTAASVLLNRSNTKPRINHESASQKEWLDVQDAVGSVAEASPFMHSPTRPPQPLHQQTVSRLVKPGIDTTVQKEIVDIEREHTDTPPPPPPSQKRAVIVKPAVALVKTNYEQRSDDAAAQPIRGGKKKKQDTHANRHQKLAAAKQQETAAEIAARKKQAVLQARAEILRVKREANARQAQENREKQQHTESQLRSQYSANYQHNFADSSMLSCTSGGGGGMRPASSASNHSNSSSISVKSKKQPPPTTRNVPPSTASVLKQQPQNATTKLPPVSSIRTGAGIVKPTFTSVSAQELRNNTAMPPPTSWKTAPSIKTPSVSRSASTTSNAAAAPAAAAFPSRNVAAKLQQIAQDRKQQQRTATDNISAAAHAAPANISKQKNPSPGLLAHIVSPVMAPPPPSSLVASVAKAPDVASKPPISVPQAVVNPNATFDASSAMPATNNARRTKPVERTVEKVSVDETRNISGDGDAPAASSSTFILGAADAALSPPSNASQLNRQDKSSQSSTHSSASVKLARDSSINFEYFTEPDISTITDITEPGSQQSVAAIEEDAADEVDDCYTSKRMTIETPAAPGPAQNAVPFSAHKDSLMINDHVPRHQLSPVSNVTSSSVTSASTTSSLLVPEKSISNATAVAAQHQTSQQLSPRRTTSSHLQLNSRMDRMSIDETPTQANSYVNLTGSSTAQSSTITKQPPPPTDAASSDDKYSTVVKKNVGSSTATSAEETTANKQSTLKKAMKISSFGAADKAAAAQDAPTNLRSLSKSVFGSVPNFGSTAHGTGNANSSAFGGPLSNSSTNFAASSNVPTFGGVPIIPSLNSSTSHFRPLSAAAPPVSIPAPPPLLMPGSVYMQQTTTTTFTASSTSVFPFNNSNNAAPFTVPAPPPFSFADKPPSTTTAAPIQQAPAGAGSNFFKTPSTFAPPTQPTLSQQQPQQQQKSQTHQPYTTGMVTAGLNTTFDIEERHDEPSNYGIDINSDDSTDDESKPKKKLPPWAETYKLRALLRAQYEKPWNLDEMFAGGIQYPVELTEIFQLNNAKSKKINVRSSSGYWEHPIPALGMLQPHPPNSNVTSSSQQQQQQAGGSTAAVRNPTKSTLSSNLPPKRV